jgi:integrase/recombinase XerD
MEARINFPDDSRPTSRSIQLGLVDDSGATDQVLASSSEIVPENYVPIEIATAELIPASIQLTVAHPLPAEFNPAAVYIASLAVGSRRTITGALDIIAGLLSGGRLNCRTLDWSQVRYQHAAAVRSELEARFDYRYANKILSALRGVARECWRLNLITAEDYQRIKHVRNIKGHSLPAGRDLSLVELHLLLQACEDGTPLGARDAALLAVLYGAGLRRTEAVALDLDDFDEREESLRVRSGKGNKDRLCPLATNGAQLIERWLTYRTRAEGPLLLPIFKGGHIVLRRMNDQSVLKALVQRAKHVPQLASFSPHDLRRTFAGDLMDAGVDISTVQQLMGHSSVVTTQRYDRRPATERRRAVRKISVPV